MMKRFFLTAALALAVALTSVTAKTADAAPIGVPLLPLEAQRANAIRDQVRRGGD